MTEKQPTIAQLVCYGIGVQFLALLGVDLWLAKTKRQMITEAARDDNAASGWIIAGVAFTIVGHLFVLPYAIKAWHKVVG